METFLSHVLTRIVGEDATFAVHAYQGKPDLLAKLEGRLRGYAKWLPESARVVVLVDQDRDDCRVLKARLERCAASAGLASRTAARGSIWRVVNRIAVEELEAWYFGEWGAVSQAYPRVRSIYNQAAYRDPDAIAGGTAEALARVLKRGGYFETGLRKVELATQVGRHFDPVSCTSPSFLVFRDAIMEAAIGSS